MLVFLAHLMQLTNTASLPRMAYFLGPPCTSELQHITLH